jgi:hypothetical protein
MKPANHIVFVLPFLVFGLKLFTQSKMSKELVSETMLKATEFMVENILKP